MILIIGSNGQLGREMQKQLGNRGWDYAAYDYPDIDIVQYYSIKKMTEALRPSVIVNCAAYTNVNQAEIDEDIAYKVNALGPKNLAEICAERDIELVHISTDYVFSGEPIMEDGQPRPYVEEDECHPCTAYGRTKLEGERFVQSFGRKWYMFRSAWLYGDGNNFVRTMLKLAEIGETLRIVNDQIGSPTSTVDLANAICELMGSGAYGLYHATSEGQCSWYELTKKIFELKAKQIEVLPITTEEYSEEHPNSAQRPKWSVLENAALKKIGKNVFRSWEDTLKEYLLGEK